MMMIIMCNEAQLVSELAGIQITLHEIETQLVLLHLGCDLQQVGTL